MSEAEINFLFFVGTVLAVSAVTFTAGFYLERWAKKRNAIAKEADKILSDLVNSYGRAKFAHQWQPQEWHFFDTVKPAPRETPPEDLGAT